MPLYTYLCENGHRTERLVSMKARDYPRACFECGGLTRRLFVDSPHVLPDGVYSHAENLGDPDAFERRLIAMRNGQKTLPRE